MKQGMTEKERAELKQQLMEHFESWLDDVLEDEAPPEGVAAEVLRALQSSEDIGDDSQPDLYAFWAGLTHLASEFEKQRETLKELRNGGSAPAGDVDLSSLEKPLQNLEKSIEAVSGVEKVIVEHVQNLEGTLNTIAGDAKTQRQDLEKHLNALLEKQTKAVTDAAAKLKPQDNGHDKLLGEIRQMFGEMAKKQDNLAKSAMSHQRDEAKKDNVEHLKVMMSVRDFLVIGREFARDGLNAISNPDQPGFIGRMFGGGKAEAIEPIKRTMTDAVKHYTLAIDRIDEELRGNDIREVKCEGVAFNPQTMNGVEFVDDPDIPDGTILGVVRPGYIRGNKLLRPAHVRVVGKRMPSQRRMPSTRRVSSQQRK